SESDIAWRSHVIVESLVDAGAKLIVVACNTATAVALESLRKRFAVPIVGLEPAVKPAIECSRSKVIGVVATPRTASSERLRRLIERYAGAASQVVVIPAPGLVELVEDGTTSGPTAYEAVRRLVAPVVDLGADVLVLGCTHYP